MNKDKQRIAIAEACGHISPRKTASGSFIASTHKNKDGKEWGGHGLPDYLNDLNAMHEVEIKLSDGDYCAFRDYLYDIAIAAQAKTNKWRWLSSTAQQRAEAFLRTIGKWEGEQ